MVDALNGEPGIYSARYAGENATYSSNVDKLLLNMKDIPYNCRTAKFVCTICCLFPDGNEICVRGECNGHIGFERAGESGFGYDPVFITESGKTFAEISLEEKAKISHRGRSLEQFVKELNKKMLGD